SCLLTGLDVRDDLRWSRLGVVELPSSKGTAPLATLGTAAGGLASNNNRSVNGIGNHFFLEIIDTQGRNGSVLVQNLGDGLPVHEVHLEPLLDVRYQERRGLTDLRGNLLSHV